jgi:NADPH2:quinone reductase
VVIRLLGSDDFPAAAKAEAAEALSAAAADKRLWYPIAARYPLDAIARAHEAVEHPSAPGRVVLDL